MLSREPLSLPDRSPLALCEDKFTAAYTSSMENLALALIAPKGTEALMLVDCEIPGEPRFFVLHKPALDTRLADPSLRFWITEVWRSLSDKSTFLERSYIIDDSDMVFEIGLPPRARIHGDTLDPGIVHLALLPPDLQKTLPLVEIGDAQLLESLDRAQPVTL